MTQEQDEKEFQKWIKTIGWHKVLFILKKTMCKRCHGSGQIYYASTWWDDNADEHPITCPDCKGAGRILREKEGK